MEDYSIVGPSASALAECAVPFLRATAPAKQEVRSQESGVRSQKSEENRVDGRTIRKDFWRCV
jgi:hypothetical protein